MKLLLTFFLMILLLPMSGEAQDDCIGYESYLHMSGGVQFRGGKGVAISGNHAFVASSWSDQYFPGSRLLVIDITDPGIPQIVGSVDTPGHAIEVAISGTLAFVVVGNPGLQIIDITDPENPQLVGSVDTPGSANDVVVLGNQVYISGGDGLHVIDISDPENPQIIGNVETPGVAREIEISGTHAYVADGSAGLQVIDISDPGYPQIVGSVVTPSDAMGVEISGTHAFVACWQSGLQVIDITTPETPQIVGSVDTPEPARDVAISGTRAFVAEYSGLQIIDIGNPENPLILTSAGITGSIVTISGSKAYVTRNSSSESDCDLVILDIFNPDPPQIVGIVETPSRVRDISISGNHAYVAGWEAGFGVIDITDPENPQIQGSVDTLSAVQGIAVLDNYAYAVTGGSSGDGHLRVIDITNSENPQVVGDVDTPGHALGVAVSGNLAYVADGPGGLQVIDISIPESPQIVGSVDTSPWKLRHLAISGTRIYALATTIGVVVSFHVIDIADLTNPQIEGILEYSLTSGFDGFAISGSHAYVADGMAGLLQVIDISDPAYLQIVGSVVTPTDAKGVQISGTHAYVACKQSGLQVIDITAPETPRIVGSVFTMDDVYDVAISGTHVFAASWLYNNDFGLVSAFPLQCGETSGIEEGYFDPEPTDTPSQLTNLSVYPNPFNPRTTISFVVDYPQAVELCIYGMTGKRVTLLANRTFQAGIHSMDWQGKDQQGRAVASGTYLLQMRTDEGVTSEKMMLIR